MYAMDAEVTKLINHNIPTPGKAFEWMVSMRIPLLFLPLQTVRANLRLATLGVTPGANRSAYRQSLICADLSSESPCLRGASSRGPDNYRMRLGYGMPRTLEKLRICGPVSGLTGWQLTEMLKV
jgi:hypothetical protein